MANVIVEEKKTFPKDPMDKKLLLSTIKKYAPKGLHLGVEKVSKPYKTSFGKFQVTVQLTVMDELEKSLQYELDEEGQYVMTEDDFGDEVKKIVVKSGYLATATLFLNISYDGDEIDEESMFKVYPSSGSYPLFKEGLINANELPEDMGRDAFETNGKELKEALEGFDFIGKVGKSNGKFKFEYLDVVRE